jgi:hypothetical protein
MSWIASEGDHRMRLKILRIMVSLVIPLPIGQSVSAAQYLARVSVTVEPMGRVIPKDFTGFSIEQYDGAKRYLGVPSSPNLVFYQLLKNLGTGTIRLGGNSSDECCWEPSKAPQPRGCHYTITPAAVEGFAKASAETSWGIIVGVNLAQNSASWALPYGVAVARAFRRVPGGKLLGFEFGNEPEFFPDNTFFEKTKYRPDPYPWQSLLKDWIPYVSAFKTNAETAAVPLYGPSFEGTELYRINSSLASWLEGVGPGNISVLTVHGYPATDDCVKGQGKVTIPLLLSSSLSQDDAWIAEARMWVETARRYGLPLQLDETNTFGCGGGEGVANVFASTVWGLDWLFTNFELGMFRVNIHMGNEAIINPVTVAPTAAADGTVSYANSVAPMYYFANLAEGNSLLPTSIQPWANVKAYAVRFSDSSPVRVFLINKDLEAKGKVKIYLSQRMGEASVMFVKAPGLSSKEVSFGGARFDEKTGLLSGVPTTASLSPDSRGNYIVDLPNASIAVVTINP